MMDFIRAAAEFNFLQYALIAGLLASIACGLVGSLVVTRRMSFIAGGIAHFVLGGMGAARYCNVVLGWKWLNPLQGALFSALLGAFIIAFLRTFAREKEDTLVSALWAVGMAAGIIFISQTPGYNGDLLNYLFGNILMVTPGDLWLIAILDVITLIIVFLYYRQLVAVSFDEEYAEIRGVPVKSFYLLFLCLIAFTVVVLVSVVGVIMVIALITLPAASMSGLSKKMWRMMLFSTCLIMLLTTSGLAISYGPGLPAGATIILLTGGVYIVLMVVKGWLRSHHKQSANS